MLLPLQAQEAHALRFVEASEAEQRAEQLAQQLTEAKRRASIALMEQMAGAREGRVVGRRSLFSVPFGLSLGFPCNAPGNPTEAREAVRLQSLEIDIAGLEARLRALRKGISTERIRLPSPVPCGMSPLSFFLIRIPLSETAHLEHVTTSRQHEEERLARQREDIFTFAERMVSCLVSWTTFESAVFSVSLISPPSQQNERQDLARLLIEDLSRSRSQLAHDIEEVLH